MTRPVALVLRALGLGDFMTGLPALQLIRRSLPDHRLVLAAGPQFEVLLPLISYLDELYPSGELMRLTGLARPVDIAIDLHGNGIASRRLLAELEPARLIAFGNRQNGLNGPEWCAAEQETQRWCRLIACTLLSPTAGCPPVADCVDRPRIEVPDGLTVLHPGAAYPSRRWPPERFVAVARCLAEAGHRVVISGGAAETALVEAIVAQTGVESLIGLSLLELFAVVATARLVVSGDTGIAHVASNYRTPSVTLFGPVSPAIWGPPVDPRHAVLFRGNGSGDPHGSNIDPALLRISVEEVLGAIEQIPADSDRMRRKPDEECGRTCGADQRRRKWIGPRDRCPAGGRRSTPDRCRHRPR
jgi:ADP-heptose:LPS heptosyltransferase